MNATIVKKYNMKEDYYYFSITDDDTKTKIVFSHCYKKEDAADIAETILRITFRNIKDRTLFCASETVFLIKAVLQFLGIKDE